MMFENVYVKILVVLTGGRRGFPNEDLIRMQGAGQLLKMHI